MKKPLPLITLWLIALLGVFSFIPKSLFADGMMIKFHPYLDRWDYSNETSQQAFINYDNGFQKMIISVGFEGGNNGGVVWLFPIPTDPSKLAIDVVKSLPQLRGEDVSKKAESNLYGARRILQLTQIYTIPFVSFYGPPLGSDDSLRAEAPQGYSKDIGQDVVVHEHLEKEGIATEIITAKTANGLYDYLKSKGLKIEIGSIPVLDNYIGKEYSFVASWITSREKIPSAQDIKGNLSLYFSSAYRFPGFFNVIDSLKQQYPEFNQAYNPINYLKSQEGEAVFQELSQAIQNNPSILSYQRGVFVTFPTNDIYFPLLPTSVYGSKTIPATIRIIGYVSPEVFQNIKNYTKTEYYIDSDVSFSDDLKTFYRGQDKNIRYTKIGINAPSKFLTDDLWINNQAPVRTYYSTFVVKHPIVNTIILLIVSSIMAGILAGLIIFRDLRKNSGKLALIALSNCLTLLGLSIATVLVSTRSKKKSTDSLLVEIKQKGYFWKRRVATILFFAATPFLLCGLIASPPLIDHVWYMLLIGRLWYPYQRASDVVIPVLVLYILPISALIIGFVIKKIKAEDGNLFEELKLAGYSSWSIQPKDKMKIAFIPVFSVSFLIISWLVVSLIGLII